MILLRIFSNRYLFFIFKQIYFILACHLITEAVISIAMHFKTAGIGQPPNNFQGDPIGDTINSLGDTGVVYSVAALKCDGYGFEFLLARYLDKGSVE